MLDALCEMQPSFGCRFKVASAFTLQACMQTKLTASAHGSLTLDLIHSLTIYRYPASHALQEQPVL